MAQIEALEVCAVRVPLNRVTSFSNRSVQSRDFGLLRLRDSGGGFGIGFCYVGTVGGELFPLAVEKILAPVLIGRDSTEVEGLWSEMYQEALLQGRAGVVMRAISAVDTALWDMNARAAGLPLHRYLGATNPLTVPAYASGGYYVEGKTPDDLAVEMAGYAALGFSAMKMKTGRLSPQQEEDRLRAVREAVGDDVVLMMDANNVWSDVTEALTYLRRFEKYRPFFIEEPFLTDDIDNHGRLSRATSIPVATGEVEAGRWRTRTLLEDGGISVLQSDAAVCGGVSEWRRIAMMAAGYGIPVCPHAFHDLHAPLVASMSNAPMVEMFLDDEVFNFSCLVSERLRHRDGAIVLHTGPGLGFDFREDQVERFGLGKGSGRASWQDCKAA